MNRPSSITDTQCKQIQLRADDLREAVLRDAADYADEWRAEGNRATIQDGYCLKVGAVRMATNALLDALEQANLYAAAIDLHEEA